jgi:hypothetical protein
VIEPTQSLKINLLPYQADRAKAYISGLIDGSTSYEARHGLVTVPNNEDAEELAEYISSLLDIKIVPLISFDPILNYNHILFTQSYNKLCNADNEIKAKIQEEVSKKGERSRGSSHDEYHKDVNCPYHQQKLKMGSLYRTDFYVLITTIERLAHVKFSEHPFSKNITIWLKDGYRKDFNIYPSKIEGKIEHQFVGFEERESEDLWGHPRKQLFPKYKRTPIQIEYTGEIISGYRKVKSASSPRIMDIGWVKETAEDFIIPSNLSLVFLNAISQGYKYKLNLLSVHYGIFKEELEVIDGCEIETDSRVDRKPKIKSVETTIQVNLNAARARTLTKSLPTLKHFLVLLRKWRYEPIDIAFIHENLKELGEAVKSRSNEAKTILENYNDFEKNSQEIKNLRHHYLIGPSSNWNRIRIEDPQNALYDEYYLLEGNPKTALIYGTPRFINKGYSKEELDSFSAVNKIVSLPPEEQRKEFFERYCKRLAYLLNLYGFEKTYIVDPYFQYGIKFYSELFAHYFDVEIML